MAEKRLYGGQISSLGSALLTLLHHKVLNPIGHQFGGHILHIHGGVRAVNPPHKSLRIGGVGFHGEGRHAPLEPQIGGPTLYVSLPSSHKNRFDGLKLAISFVLLWRVSKFSDTK